MSPVLVRVVLLLLLFASTAVAQITVDRTTPRRTLVGFQSACGGGDWERASKYLDLRAAAHKGRGAELAHELCFVLQHKTNIDVSAVADATGDDTTGPVTVTHVDINEATVPIELARVRQTDGTYTWRLSRATVAAIPELDAAYGPRGLEERMPEVLREPYVLEMAPWQWIGIAIVTLISFAIARLLAWIVLAMAGRVAARTKNTLDEHLVAAVTRPVRLLAAVATFRTVAPILTLGSDAWAPITRLLSTLTVLGFAWLAIRFMRGGTNWLEAHAAEGDREYSSRGLRTQLAVLYRVASVVVLVVAVAAILLQFEVVRSVGTSLLASAGIAGITIGLAAQKSLGAIIAGIQISIAQPVRIGDTVVVDSQQGVVEEIHLTYAVLRLPDDRRLIAPIGRFLDQSFENWTKLGAALRGYVMLPADFGAPIDALRTELGAICKRAPEFDGRSCRLDVLDVTPDKGLMLRATVSAKNADALWELRCRVREELVKFLVKLESGKHVPKTRTQAVS